MKARRLLGVSAAAVALSAVPSVAAATTETPPHPTPFGPQRPYEPDVPGPENVESGTVTYTRDGGSRFGVEITFDTQRTTTTGEEPAAPREFVFLFDSSVRFNPHLFPTCDRSVIEERGAAACPDGSQVGSGRAAFYRGGEGDVLVYNTTYDNGLRGVLIHIPATGAILENTFEQVVGDYREDYRWGLNEIVPPNDIPPQDRASTSEFAVTFGGVHKGRSYVQSLARPGAEVSAGVWSEYVTGQVTLNEGTTVRP